MDSSRPELLVLPLRDLEVLLEDDLRIHHGEGCSHGGSQTAKWAASISARCQTRCRNEAMHDMPASVVAYGIGHTAARRPMLRDTGLPDEDGHSKSISGEHAHFRADGLPARTLARMAPPIHTDRCSVLAGMYSGQVTIDGAADAGSSARMSPTQRWARPGTALPPPHTTMLSSTACVRVHGRVTAMVGVKVQASSKPISEALQRMHMLS